MDIHASFFYSSVCSFICSFNHLSWLTILLIIWQMGQLILTIPVGRARKDQDASSACGPQPLVGWLSRLKTLIASGNLKIGLHRFMDVEEKACSRALEISAWWHHIKLRLFECVRGIRGKHLKHFWTVFFLGSGWACEALNTFFLNFRLDPYW